MADQSGRAVQPLYIWDRKMAENDGTGKTKVIEKERITSEAVPEKGATRIYDVPVKETIIASKHRWISDEDEDVIKPVGRNTIARGDTRIYGQSLKETRIYDKPQTADPGPDERKSAGKKIREAVTGAAAWFRGMYTDLRSVRVSDSAKFSRFLKVTGVFALILLLEIGYFAFAHRTARLPADIKEAKEELELTQKESVILQEEIDELGGYDSIEEQRRSWERLKEKVEKAEAETSS